MDIKDFILISGGILIALVVAHGFWIAWKAKREPYRLDIVPDLIPDRDVDDIERLRGELPNGGARVVSGVTEDLFDDPLLDPAPPSAERQEPLPLDTPPPTLMDPIGPRTEPEVGPADPVPAGPRARPAGARPVADLKTEPRRPRVREVSLVTDAPEASEHTGGPALDPQVEELLIVNVLAPRGHQFDGEALVNALRAQGLRYGDMNIFHRIDAATKAKQFSVANVIEPGTFDLSDIEALRSPGMSFFLQLPGPDDASGAFEAMLEAAGRVAADLGGEVRDEQLSMLTGQTREHMRQRISDFARRRLSKRA